MPSSVPRMRCKGYVDSPPLQQSVSNPVPKTENNASNRGYPASKKPTTLSSGAQRRVDKNAIERRHAVIRVSQNFLPVNNSLNLAHHANSSGGVDTPSSATKLLAINLLAFNFKSAACEACPVTFAAHAPGFEVIWTYSWLLLNCAAISADVGAKEI